MFNGTKDSRYIYFECQYVCIFNVRTTSVNGSAFLCFVFSINLLATADRNQWIKNSIVWNWLSHSSPSSWRNLHKISRGKKHTISLKLFDGHIEFTKCWLKNSISSICTYYVSIAFVFVNYVNGRLEFGWSAFSPSLSAIVNGYVSMGHAIATLPKAVYTRPLLLSALPSIHTIFPSGVVSNIEWFGLFTHTVRLLCKTCNRTHSEHTHKNRGVILFLCYLHRLPPHKISNMASIFHLWR